MDFMDFKSLISKIFYNFYANFLGIGKVKNQKLYQVNIYPRKFTTIFFKQIGFIELRTIMNKIAHSGHILDGNFMPYGIIQSSFALYYYNFLK